MRPAERRSTFSLWDISSRPDCSAGRWAVDFGDRTAEEAQEWPEPWSWIESKVKAERANASAAVRQVPWWQYWRRRPALYNSIASLDRVTVITRVSKVVMPVMVPTGQVMSEQVVVFATDDTAMLALLSSAPHYWWTLTRASTLQTRVRYTPSDVFETLPLPELTSEIRELGDRLDTYRRELMLAAKSA
ncbi:type IIL restriction-modification enzyme MmeI [Microbispora sp. CA-135349]|uniref:type IIL restriction-modification enzyme MmeI n=1 Tax=Microbispora sp. CA-135349 TaxID=3239953 RepID=UPI003D8C7442